MENLRLGEPVTLRTTALDSLLCSQSLWAAGAAGQNSCEPSCPEGCSGGEKVPNPVNCRQYYECLEDCVPSDPVFDCPDGSKFDADTFECVEDDGTATITCGTCSPKCKFTCTEGYTGVIADREDCQIGYLCQFETPLQVTCSGDTLYFDGDNCQANETLCCDKCQVYCEAPFIETLDPYDCTAYYYCTEEGWPLPEDRYQCDDGEMFVDGHCKVTGDSADCYEPCASIFP